VVLYSDESTGPCMA